MPRKPADQLRTGFTTGACATAASAAAYTAMVTGEWPNPVQITLPRGQTPRFELVATESGPEWARATVQKDAGDDPDVTHGALITATLRPLGHEISFRAGEGVGMITKPGLPIPVGEPAINPVPRQMMRETVEALAVKLDGPTGIEIEISVAGGAELAKKTWNPRLGIQGGISILGTTGIVKPYSCSAWIASIHRGIDVARATGITHAVGATGSTSENVAQRHFALPDHAMLDMGDFAGGMLKYLRQHPIPRVTIAGGFGKLTKLAQGALDLHSARSQVDFVALAALAGRDDLKACNTAMEALQIAPELAALIADRARIKAQTTLRDTPIKLDILLIDRKGRIVEQSHG